MLRIGTMTGRIRRPCRSRRSILPSAAPSHSRRGRRDGYCPPSPRFGKALLPLLAVMLVPAFAAPLAEREEPLLDPAESAWRRVAKGDAAEAEAEARRILRRDAGDARAAYCLCEVLHEQGRAVEALAFLRDSLPSAAGHGLVLLAEGRLAGLAGESAAAESLLAQALADFEASGDTGGRQVAGEQLSLLLLQAERSAAAGSLLTASLALAEELERPLAATYCRLKLGVALTRGRQADAAEPMLLEAIEEAARLEIPLWVGDGEISLSIVYRLRMDLDRALHHREAALAAYREADNLPGQARSQHYIATIRIFQGELTRAISELREALDLSRAAGEDGEASACLGDLAAIDYILGDEEQARRLMREALRMGEGHRPARWIGGVQNNVGLTYQDQRRYGDALEWFERSLATLWDVGERRNEAATLNNIGRCLCEMGEYERGIARLEEAAGLAREWRIPLTEAHVMRDLGFCRLEIGDPFAAEEAFAAAEAVARGTGYFHVLRTVHLGRALAARERGSREETRSYLTEAIDVAEGVRSRCAGSAPVQSSYFGMASQDYVELVDLLQAMHRDAPEAGYAREAFDYAQRAKGRAFLDMLAEAQVDLRCRADTLYQRRESEILNRVSELLAEEAEGPVRAEDEIARLEEELLLLELELRRADPRYAELQYPRPSKLPEVQEELLAGDELLLEYLLGDRASYLWAVTPTSFRLHLLPPRELLEEQAAQLLPLLGDYNLLGPEPSYFVAAAAELSRALLSPVAEELAAARRVIVAPHGILHYLPFEALLLGETSGSPESFGALPYLVKRVDVSYVPSVSSLARLRSTERLAPEQGRSSTADRELLIVGDPLPPAPGEVSAFARTVLGDAPAPLRFAAREISGIRALFPAGNGIVLTGADATPARLREAAASGPFRLVHFAAHGLFNERRPQFSGLLLSPDAAGEGFLSLGEIFALELESEQVVLATCSSALGEHVSGEGLVGLTRAFHYAGARSVVASLWEVSDRTSADFMRSFYREMDRPSGTRRDHALAQAKRALIGSETGGTGPVLAHPFFWAAYVMHGDGR